LVSDILAGDGNIANLFYSASLFCGIGIMFAVLWQWSGEYSGQLLLPPGCAVVRGVRVELTMLAGEVTLITPPTPVPRVRLLQVCSFYTKLLSILYYIF
jgi:hypothetical protein